MIKTHTENKPDKQEQPILKWQYNSDQYTKKNKWVFSRDLKRDREGVNLISKGKALPLQMYTIPLPLVTKIPF